MAEGEQLADADKLVVGEKGLEKVDLAASLPEGNDNTRVGDAQELRVAQSEGLSRLEGLEGTLVSPDFTTGVAEPSEGGLGVALQLACLSRVRAAEGTAEAMALLLRVRPWAAVRLAEPGISRRNDSSSLLCPMEAVCAGLPVAACAFDESLAKTSTWRRLMARFTS